jgi:hypothetical protein
MAVVAELLDYIFFVFLVMTLYILLQHVHKSVARAMLVFVALAAAIVSLNTVFLFEGLQVATDSSYEAAFGSAGSNALVLLLLDLQHYGLLIGQVFFGLWLVPLGYLAYRSGMFPKALGVVLIVAGVCYLVDLFADASLFGAGGTGWDQLLERRANLFTGVLDAVMRDDPKGRVACETLATTNRVVIAGEPLQQLVGRRGRSRSRSGGHPLEPALHPPQARTCAPWFSVPDVLASSRAPLRGGLRPAYA